MIYIFVSEFNILLDSKYPDINKTFHDLSGPSAHWILLSLLWEIYAGIECSSLQSGPNGIVY